MFGLRLCLWLQPGTLCAVSRVQTVHKLASLQKVTALPPKKIQSLLYPFSELEAYLDRFVDSWFCTVLRHVFFPEFNVICYISRSVDKTQFQLFHPSLEDMVKAEKLFCSSSSHRIDYYTSAERMDHVPALKQPEVSGPSDWKQLGHVQWKPEFSNLVSQLGTIILGTGTSTWVLVLDVGIHSTDRY